ncbi:MAG: AbrB/MazE/SpoVT family DNA-binding domain-containing protein [Desulfitobacterium sp.]
MKATGIVRRIDDLGRVVIPKEIRRTLQIAEGDPVEIFTEEEGIILRKYQPSETCAFCGEGDKLHQLSGKWICRKCAVTLARALDLKGGEKK